MKKIAADRNYRNYRKITKMANPMPKSHPGIGNSPGGYSGGGGGMGYYGPGSVEPAFKSAHHALRKACEEYEKIADSPLHNLYPGDDEPRAEMIAGWLLGKTDGASLYNYSGEDVLKIADKIEDQLRWNTTGQSLPFVVDPGRGKKYFRAIMTGDGHGTDNAAAKFAWNRFTNLLEKAKKDYEALSNRERAYGVIDSGYGGRAVDVVFPEEGEYGGPMPAEDPGLADVPIMVPMEPGHRREYEWQPRPGETWTEPQ